MANQKKAKKTLAKKAMKKTKGGAHVDYFLKLDTVDGDVTSRPSESLSINYTKIQL